ncbi:MAG TPA: N-acetylglucosamine-6-phosphate deacetylase [Anaerolineae bacterium]|nr:N-acetylglucosamine-6-phosphate deacetylase [Anaerolineae bacterium]
MTSDKFALTNGRIILPDEIVSGKAVIVEGEKIAAITDAASLPGGIPTVDVGGRIISPGLIDIHIHGAVGHTFNEPTADAFAAITAETARRGITSLLATTATAPIPDLAASLAFCRRWMAEDHNGSQVLGAHVEGPYFNLEQRGAQDPANLRAPDDGAAEQLLAYRDIIKIFTFAPELPGALALTARLKELGIVAAAGHSSARDEDVLAAMERGLSHIIHIWSAQSTTVRQGPWRKPGLLEASLTFDGLTVEMISDNRHLPPTLMKLAYKCLGPDRLCVISDAVSGAGLPEGSRFKMGEMEYEVHDGVGMMFDRSSFAGSTTLISQMIPILTGLVGIPLVEAVRMASLTPARVIGVDARKGSLQAGKDADIAIFNEDFTAWRTMIGGKTVKNEE